MHLTRLICVVLTLATVIAPTVFAQRQLGKKKGPTSKLYLAESVGEGQIITEGRAYPAKQATAFDAPGTVIETKGDSHQAFVYSNGTGMYVAANTRIEVDRFVQEPFRPDRNSIESEPSISQSDVFVARGAVGLCTGQLVSGSTMNYSTPHAGVNIRSGKLAIETDGDSSSIFVLEGDVTVRSGSRDTGGTLVRAGEQLSIRPGRAGRPPTISVAPIPPARIADLDEKVTAACNARKTVSFEVIETKSGFGAGATDEEIAASDAAPDAADAPSDQEIVANPVVPETPPTNVEVSPAQINPTPGA